MKIFFRISVLGAQEGGNTLGLILAVIVLVNLCVDMTGGDGAPHPWSSIPSGRVDSELVFVIS